MITQMDIAAVLSCSQSTINFILNGTRPVSWPLAEKIDTIFPGKGVKFWRNAKTTDLEKMFSSEVFEQEALKRLKSTTCALKNKTIKIPGDSNAV